MPIPSLRSPSCRLLLLFALLSCGGIEPVAPHEPITDPTQLYMALTLDHPAINLSTVAPYNTLQLTATPRNALGEPITGLPAATFRSGDTATVRVSADGLIEALQPGQGIRVFAELGTLGNVRHVVTAVVNVTDNPTPPVLASLSIQPIPPDVPHRAMFPSNGGGAAAALLLEFAGIPTSPPLIPARALDEGGNEIPDLAIEYRSLDLSIASLGPDGNSWRNMVPGRVKFVAQTIAYGVTKADTAEYTITPPFFNGVDLLATGSGISPTEVTVVTNAFVFWWNLSGQPADIVFDDPGAAAEATPLCEAYGAAYCGAGNITAFGDSAGANLESFDDVFNNSRVRQFPVAGVYRYRSTVTGASGSIVVKDPLAPSN